MSEPDDEAFAAKALGALPKVQPTAALQRKVAAIPLTHPRPASVSPFELWHWVLGLCSAALLGLLAGWLTLESEVNTESAPAIAALEDSTSEDSNAEEAEVQGMLALALGEEDLALDEVE